MFKVMFAAIAIVSLSACAAIKSPIDEGYQFGDTTSSVINLQAKYCSEADPVRRAVILALIRSAVPAYPASGACTDLIDLVGQDTVDKLAEEVSEVDIEQAVKDKEKFTKE